LALFSECRKSIGPNVDLVGYLMLGNYTSRVFFTLIWKSKIFLK